MRSIPFSLLAAISLALPIGAQEVTPFADPSRLISIGGSITEIIYELGKDDLLVARDSTATYPDQALQLPDVGYMRALAPEGVLSVEPSAIIALEGSGPIDAIEVLENASVPIVFVPEIFTQDGVITKVRTVGEALNAENEAEALIGRIQADFDAVQDRISKIEQPKSVLFVLSMVGGRVNAAGTGTAADGIIALAGARNAITEYEGYRQLSEEAIITANPDLVLVMDRGGDHAASEDELLSHPAIALTNAGQTGSVIRMDGSYLLGFGPRAAAAALDLADAIYGAPEPAQ
ncbi:heme/hemin ABC transporter substrate-binding protein [Pelagibacterium lentulum]|uniref:Hemin ABC transporter substrate-binding protein n=1 Tax=Pelagibacterium lentulum TaxID=2029865 RepID=A0A916VV67_9HYPH|nr:ABC transporter substrate-binding protein [Pelagibacterium lentulum]GGA39013.1 hemin ABC transporter substrate-binding protein [Pelagibacterium lentulum]